METSQVRTAIITGASSGIGLYATKALIARGWHVIMACRDVAKGRSAAEDLGLPENRYTLEEVDLGSLASVHAFCDRFQAQGQALDALVCNAATYMPRLAEPLRSREGFELSVATNFSATSRW